MLAQLGEIHVSYWYKAVFCSSLHGYARRKWENFDNTIHADWAEPWLCLCFPAAVEESGYNSSSWTISGAADCGTEYGNPLLCRLT